ncbi:MULTISPECIES: lipoprotein insertase outer membrane protein LolB [unclassified Acinetobacter]|uniref:lipoprotein insertase outer membrane protein LolB n=1 Tax=unclassified Acinetobacter TaxID=196816 RepID=UPI002934F2C2|nr:MULTISPECIES: lipoprotein insertase outer membrane protein LolB [unclassified Acinetobacter]WOE31351.1 lipoprotein insertase outer membrane protein LolB [Acinetobacter sp. SAAs470]WOE39547.1 lipoprotein insertase outer membrane protein LolB [Acinetobacter sp. SAAs474]
MSMYLKRGLSSLTTLCLLLTGCQSIPQHTTTISPPNSEEISTHPDHGPQFSLQGKIGVRTPQQSGSAFFTWVQQQAQFNIELSGILGLGKTQISGQPGQVELNSARTGVISAASPEELLQQATGWQAPITYLIDWVQAKAATDTAEIAKDSQMRPTQIIEENWVVDLNYHENNPLPYKLVLKQALESGQENRITMVIQDR